MFLSGSVILINSGLMEFTAKVGNKGYFHYIEQW